MNVRELKEFLDTLDPDLPVVFIDAGKCWVIDEEDITKSFTVYHQVVETNGNKKIEVKNNDVIVLGGY